MNLFGLSIRRKAPQLAPVDSRGSWWTTIRESFAGAWQDNVEVTVDGVLSFFAVYSCVSLIASDIAKMRIMLVEEKDGVWTETENSAYSPVLRRPNHYQNRIQFAQWWITSKLLHGNTYVLKQRDGRGVVGAMYILDPRRVRVLVSPDGDVFYALQRDSLSGRNATDWLDGFDIVVPAREIIHDIKVALFHPLVGVSPIYACGLSALQGLKIQNNSYRFFANGSRPGSIITAPGAISALAAARIKEAWETNYGGDNYGKVAVLGDNMKFEAMTISAEDAQLIEQLRWTGETVCSCFHVPSYMIGIGPPPAYDNIEALNLQYYSQALQNDIESMELCLDEGMELKRPYGTEMDLDSLLRMDTPTRIKVAADAIGSGGVSPDEARKKWLGLGPVKGGDTPYMQQQNYSLSALDARDRAAPAPSSAAPPAPASPSAPQRPRALGARLTAKALASGLESAL